MAIRQAFCYFLLANLSVAQTPTNWKFEEAYSDSENVFIGKVLKVETGLDYTPESAATNQKQNGGARVVWRDARRFTLSVMENLKGETASVVELLNIGGSPALISEGVKSVEDRGSYAGSGTGIPRPMLDRNRVYLIFVDLDEGGNRGRIGLRSAFPLEETEDELQVLRLLRYDPSISTFSDAVQAIKEWEEQTKEQKRITISQFESEFLEILNTSPELKERKQRLKLFIQKLGFKNLRSPDSAAPQGLSEIDAAKDRLWENASQEIIKINMILEARKVKASKTNKP